MSDNKHQPGNSARNSTDTNSKEIITEPDTQQDIQEGDVNIQASGLEAEHEGSTETIFHRSTSTVKEVSKRDAVIRVLREGLLYVGHYFQRLFSFPLVREPITFCRPDDFTSSGEFHPDRKYDKAEGDALEILVNYDKATKEIFDQILQARKEALASKDKYQYQPIDLTKYPGWDLGVVERLRSTFQVFDVNLSGLIEFDELCEVLFEFGDKTPLEERRKHFDAVDINRAGAIDFEEFITMTYTLTMKPVDGSAMSLAESYKKIDRNMSRIRSLDVVQQLQAGLF